MAATNYTPIQLYFSTTASAVPLAANLAQGELAINITDGKLYYEDNAGVVQVIATKGAGTIGGSTTQIQYNNAGALAGSSAMTFNNSTNVVTLTTLNLTNALGATYGGTAQSTYAQGDFLYASASNTLSKLGIGAANYILTSTGTVPQWVAPSSIAVLTATNLAGGLGGSVPYQSAVDTTTFLAIGAANRVMTSTGSAPQWVTSLTGLTGVSSSAITNTGLTSGRVVYSTTGGAQTDDADLTFDGTTLSAGGYSTVGLTTLVKTVKIGDSNFNGVAVFAPSTPAKLYIGTGTVTDTTSAIGATNATGAVASLAITPIAATNTSVTYTNASTLYIAGAPSAGTNVTLTNPYALYVAAGASFFGGAVTYGAGLTLGGNLLFSPDNTYDIGASGATRPRSLYIGTNSYIAGKELIGSVTTTNNLRLGQTFAVVNVSAANAGMALTSYSGTGSGFRSLLDFNRSRGTTDGSMTAVVTSDLLGSVIYRGSDGTSFVDGAAVQAYVDNTVTTGAVPTALSFWTTTNGTIVNRYSISSAGAHTWNAGGGMVFSSIGQLVVNGGGATAGAALTLQESAGFPSALSMINRNNNQTWTVAVDANAVDDKILGFIDTTGTALRMGLTNTGNLFVGGTSATARLESYTATNNQTAFTATSITPTGSTKAAIITIGANNSAFSGGYGLQVFDKTGNGGGAQSGYGVYIAAPYDGTNASGGTYALAKYGLYIDDIYSFYGINSATANANFGIYVKGGANNYIAGTLGIGTTAAAEKLHVVTGTTYAATFNTTVTSASSTRISIGSLGTAAGGTGGSAAIGNATNHSATAQSSLTFYSHDGTTLNEVGRFNPNGYLLVGTTTAAGASRLVVATTTAVDATLTVKAEAANYASIINIEAQNDNGAIYNYIASNTTSVTQHWKISGGAATNTMAFSTGGTERARFNSTGAMVFAGGTTTADGIGITFPATQSASTNANTLDDYEEGTFTPTFGSFDGTYASQSGTYTKIGRLVTVEVYLAAASLGTSSGNSITVGNFPFTKLGGNTYGVSSSVHGTSWATPKTSPNMLLPGSSTVAVVYVTMFSGASGFQPTYADIGTSGNMLFSMTYMATS